MYRPIRFKFGGRSGRLVCDGVTALVDKPGGNTMLRGVASGKVAAHTANVVPS